MAVCNKSITTLLGPSKLSDIRRGTNPQNNARTLAFEFVFFFFMALFHRMSQKRHAAE